MKSAVKTQGFLQVNVFITCGVHWGPLWYPTVYLFMMLHRSWVTKMLSQQSRISLQTGNISKCVPCR